MIHSSHVAGPVAAAILGLFATVGAAQQDIPLPEMLGQTHVHGLAFAGEDLLMATHHGLWALDLAAGRASLVGTSRDDFMGFSPHPTEAGRFYASGHPAQGGNLGIIGSTDGGATWAQLSPGVGGPVDFHQMAVSLADPAVLYGIHHGTSLQRSDDAGLTWREAGPAPEGIIDLATSPEDANRLFAATRSGLLRSDDGGASWSAAHPTTAPVSFVEVTPQGEIFAQALDQGLLHARDAAAPDWQILTDGLGEDYILHFTQMDGEAGPLVAATAAGALLTSTDGGQSWELVARAR